MNFTSESEDDPFILHVLIYEQSSVICCAKPEWHITQASLFHHPFLFVLNFFWNPCHVDFCWDLGCCHCLTWKWEGFINSVAQQFAFVAILMGELFLTFSSLNLVWKRSDRGVWWLGLPVHLSTIDSCQIMFPCVMELASTAVLPIIKSSC